MAEDTEDEDRLVKAHRVFVRLVLPPYTIHFKSPGYMKDATLDMLDHRVCKKTLRLTAQHAKIRLVIGTDRTFWQELVLVFRAAIPSLEQRSFSVWDPSAVDYESTSSVLIATHYPTLWKDIERLNDLVSISRNVITNSGMAQDLAAECGLEEEIFRMINCCVRVTARGYDGDAGTGDEERWQWIVGAYKKLLITSLQFLNNLAARNERRKLMLWVSLFDNHNDSRAGANLNGDKGSAVSLPSAPEPPVSTTDILVALGETSRPKVDAAADALRAKRLLAPKGQLRPSRPVSGYVLFVKWHTDRVKEELGSNATATDVAAELSSQWSRIPENNRKEWSVRYDELMAQYDRDLEQYNSAKKALAVDRLHSEKSQIDQVAIRIAQIEEQLSESIQRDVPHVAPLDLPLAAEATKNSLLGDELRKVSEDDFKMHFTAAAGSKILETGKAELLKRLDTTPPAPLRLDHTQLASPSSPQAAIEAPEYVESQLQPQPESQSHAEEDLSELDSEGEESEDEDYGSSTEDGRGLLTDVPLILGPSEIEVLPMIVMSGIVPPAKSSVDAQEDYDAVVNMHTVRCHLLLAQDNGKNLLRELLIFVAAWDLREEELYFKFMLKIMESILVNGLMPYAYHAFRDKSRSKDIISPAQAVIMKLLTNIFRSRAEAARQSLNTSEPLPYPSRVDVHIVNFISTEFRQHIIPQTCALIFLQGKIHQNLASPEDFPLNLWDMERMYEGVYQYLEFFAVLTEEQTWKDVMAQWEISSELVTMLRELESAIPKSVGGQNVSVPPVSTPRRAVSAGELDHAAPKSVTSPPSKMLPESLWRYNPNTGSPMNEHLPVGLTRYDPATGEQVTDCFGKRLTKSVVADPRAPYPPLPPPALPEPVPVASMPAASAVTDAAAPDGQPPLAYNEEAQDEPSDFEWRNLKKLTVLVLSSLIWKNKRVQDQVREHGGLEALVGCCKHDEHNPYIREHAIMCLRFAVEGNADNADVIRRLAGQEHFQQTPQEMSPVDIVEQEDDDSEGSEEEVDEEPLSQALLTTPFTPGAVPKEVLDTQGYETFMDGKGQVGLRRKEHFASAASLTSAVQAVQGAMSTIQSLGGSSFGASGNVSGQMIASGTGTSASASVQGMRKMTTKMAAERAAEIMQTALRDLPLPAALDRENKDIIARLKRTALELSDEVMAASGQAGVAQDGAMTVDLAGAGAGTLGLPNFADDGASGVNGGNSTNKGGRA